MQSTDKKPRNREAEAMVEDWTEEKLVSPSSISRYWALRLSAYEMEKTFLHYTDYKESPSVNYDWMWDLYVPLLPVG